jgi:hypothetical protein
MTLKVETVILGPDTEQYAGKGQAVTNISHIAFYASTPTYHSVLEHHDWMDVAGELHQLTRAGKWTELPKLITDDMLEEWGIISTFDDFADPCRARCDGLFDTVLLDLPPAARADADFIRSTVPVRG